jgi:hypothetical protein
MLDGPVAILSLASVAAAVTAAGTVALEPNPRAIRSMLGHNLEKHICWGTLFFTWRGVKFCAGVDVSDDISWSSLSSDCVVIIQVDSLEQLLVKAALAIGIIVLFS